jgi:hypothetical protein
MNPPGGGEFSVIPGGRGGQGAGVVGGATVRGSLAGKGGMLGCWSWNVFEADAGWIAFG